MHNGIRVKSIPLKMNKRLNVNCFSLTGIFNKQVVYPQLNEKSNETNIPPINTKDSALFRRFIVVLHPSFGATVGEE